MAYKKRIFKEKPSLKNAMQPFSNIQKYRGVALQNTVQVTSAATKYSGAEHTSKWESRTCSSCVVFLGGSQFCHFYPNFKYI